jgi:hypothetical protein
MQLPNVTEQNVHKSNVHVPERGTVFDIAVTKRISAQNSNATGCTVHCSNQTTKLQNTSSQKTSIVTKRPL